MVTPPSESRRESRVRVQYEDDGSADGYAALYDGLSPSTRYFRSRLHAVLEALGRSPGGDLLDVGCGPGMLARQVIEKRPGEFRIHGLDMSAAMIRTAAANLGDADGVRLTVGRVESLPFDDASFDVVVGTGVLEYVDVSVALKEIARVTRPGGLVLVTMLNPLSPYRLFEWGIFWPLLRAAGRVEGLVGRPPERRHGAVPSGIRAVPSSRLREMMRAQGIIPEDVVHYDLNLLLPPVDRFVRRRDRRWRENPGSTVGRGARRWMGTAYLVTAHRDKEPTT